VGYRVRVLDAELATVMRSAGAVLIEGPKACGKTVTATQVAKTVVRLDTDVAAQAAIAIDPALLLDGPAPILLDEWQVAPAIWNAVRRAVDDRTERGQFILTGSAVPQDDVNRHSGAGRFATLRMRPMSLYESGHSNGQISLAALMDAQPQRAADTGIKVPDVIERIVAGGWPAQIDEPVATAARAARDYLAQIREVDVSRVGATRRDPAKVGRLLTSLARNTATEANASSLAADTGGSDGPVDRGTIGEYLEVLERLMIVEDQPAWATHMRSRTPQRTSSKRHFVDPSLAVAALGTGTRGLLSGLNLTGFLFESLVVRDLRVLSQPLEGSVKHFRDSKGLEVDAVVQLADGRWAAFEVKLGVGQVEAGAASLLAFAARVDTTKVGTPAALAVITSTGFGYRRPDGVHVIPIGTLGP
jgi:predicted AAA+ superfamily ATPase